MTKEQFIERFKLQFLPYIESDEPTVQVVRYLSNFLSDEGLSVPAVELRFSNENSVGQIVNELILTGLDVLHKVVLNGEDICIITVTTPEAVNIAINQRSHKQFVDWQSVEDFVLDVAEDVKKRGLSPVGIYAIPRGGLCLGAMLSYRLELPLLLSPVEGCIIIDDIADSGKTLIHYTKNDTQFNEYYIATMYYSKRSKVIPTFWKHEKKDKWIVFPWEEIQHRN